MSESIWASMVGHEAALAALGRGVAQGRVAQGYLFCGPPQVGKGTAALGLAQSLLCQSDARPEPGWACGACAACAQVARGAHPAVRVIEPEEQGGATSRARIHKIATVRELQREIALRAFTAGWRLYVLRGAEVLTEEAANCLLKTLEEPPPQVVLLLTTDQPQALLPTVVSRLRRVDFAPVPTLAVRAWLGQRGVAPDAAALYASLAAGRPGWGLALASDPVMQATRTRALQRAQGLGTEPRVAALAAAQELLTAEGDAPGSQRARLELVLQTLEWWYRDALVLQATDDATAVVNHDVQGGVRAFAQRWGPEELHAGLAALHQARRALRRNANVQLVLEVLWLRLARGG